jgi:S1-C subfamily serine protease
VNEVDRPGYPATEFGLGGVEPIPHPPTPARRPLRLLIIVLVALIAVVALEVGHVAVPSGVVPPSSSLGTPPAISPDSVPPASWVPRTSSSTSNAALDLSSLAAEVDPAVVDINTELGVPNGQGAGTGVVLSPTGEVLTNNHVINGATSITATDAGNGQTYPATVVGYDPTHDVAVLQLQGASGLHTAAIGDSDAVSIGDQIAAIGNAGGRGGTPSIAAGTVSALSQTATVSDDVTGGAEQLSGMIQVAADVQPGDSGGPLVNTAGQVIGIDTAGSAGSRRQSGGDIGLAIPINDAITISRQIETGTASATVHIGASGILGILIQDPGTQTVPGHRGRLGHRYGSAGAAVAGVVPGSPAAGAGLTAGDTIVSLDATAVDSPATLTAVLTGHHPGDRMQVIWVDVSGQQHSASLRLAAGPPS